MKFVLMTGRTMALLATLLLFGCSRAEREPMPADIAGLSPEDSIAAIHVVLQFGERLQRVSLTAASSVARESIRKEYGDLVSPSLLENWLHNPAGAPGRATSSPWPDRIEIMAAAPVQTGGSTPPLTVLGNIVERTSADPPDGASGRIPVRVTVARQNGGWRIVEYTRGRPEDALHPGAPGTSSGSSSSADPADSPEGAADALRAYYRAIAEGRYRDAYDLWGSNGGASGQSFEEFREGFAHTASVEAVVGPPGRMEGAAGSRYVEIPVRVTAQSVEGTRETFEGAYTLRRSVVDGATPRQRAWHIDSARMRRAA